MRTRLLALACCLAAALPLSSCTMPTHEEQVKANETYLAKEGITALEVGSPAPALDGAVDTAGVPLQLDALQAGHAKGVVLFFIPAIDTPNSQRNLLDLDRRSAALAAQGIGVCAVIPGSAEQVAAWTSSIGAKLPAAADPAGSVARAWGCLSPTGQFPQRTTAGIAADGKLVLFYRGLPDDKTLQGAFGIAVK